MSCGKNKSLHTDLLDVLLQYLSNECILWDNVNDTPSESCFAGCSVVELASVFLMSTPRSIDVKWNFSDGYNVQLPLQTNSLFISVFIYKQPITMTMKITITQIMVDQNIPFLFKREQEIELNNTHLRDLSVNKVVLHIRFAFQKQPTNHRVWKLETLCISTTKGDARLKDSQYWVVYLVVGRSNKDLLRDHAKVFTGTNPPSSFSTAKDTVWLSINHFSHSIHNFWGNWRWKIGWSNRSCLNIYATIHSLFGASHIMWKHRFSTQSLNKELCSELNTVGPS